MVTGTGRVGALRPLEPLRFIPRSPPQIVKLSGRRSPSSSPRPLCAAVAVVAQEDVAVEVELPKGGMSIDVIDTFKFNEEGQITEMNAYWGPSNITQI